MSVLLSLIKEDSHLWLSKLLLKKRKFEIELEFVIFSKKLLSGKNSTFSHQTRTVLFWGKKPLLIPLFWFQLRRIVLPKQQLAIFNDLCSSYIQTHKYKWQLSEFQTFLVLNWNQKDKETILMANIYFHRFHAVTDQRQSYVNVTLIRLVKKTKMPPTSL